jgi:hypothetical protein
MPFPAPCITAKTAADEQQERSADGVHQRGQASGQQRMKPSQNAKFEQSSCHLRRADQGAYSDGRRQRGAVRLKKSR